MPLSVFVTFLCHVALTYKMTSGRDVHTWDVNMIDLFAVGVYKRFNELHVNSVQNEGFSDCICSVIQLTYYLFLRTRSCLTFLIPDDA